MEDERKVSVPVVKRFVREVVGCTCSDEVFKRVEVKLGSSAIRSCAADYEARKGAFSAQAVEKLTEPNG
jgi:hypothetical protein